MSFDRIPSFIQLEIVSYLNVRDAGRFMSTSCKNYLLMTEVARCNPYIVAEASRAEDNCSAKGVISRAVTKIPSKPNIVFAFYEHSIYDMKQSLERLLPSDTSVIAAEAMNVQANVDGAVTNTGGTYDDDDEGTGVSILLGSFPESISGSCIVTGSSIKNARCRTDVYASVKQILQISGLIGGQEWSTFILYACGLRGHSLASYVIEILQVSHAEAAIIGGVCDSALVRTHPVSLTSSSTISRTKSGVVVLALGGNTPLRACVSRGMEPLHAPHVQISDSFPIYNQYNNDMTNREDETSQSPIGYVVSKIRRTDSALEEETVISDWIGMSGAGDYLGIKRPDDMVDWKEAGLPYVASVEKDMLRAGSIVIRFIDNGVGMKIETLQHLFRDDEHIRIKSDHSGQGTGLGLRISKAIVEMHGGLISGKSDGTDRGCVFTVELPVQVHKNMRDLSLLEQEEDAPFDIEDIPCEEECLSPSALTLSSFETNNIRTSQLAAAIDILHDSANGDSAGPHSAHQPRISTYEVCKAFEYEDLSSTRRQRVLVVDDVAVCRKVLIKTLVRSGYECYEAYDGQDCLDQYNRLIAINKPVDLVLMDYEMPRMNGPSAAQILREGGCMVPIIGVTGNVLLKDKENFLSHGASAVLFKPLALDHLKTTIVDLNGKSKGNEI